MTGYNVFDEISDLAEMFEETMPRKSANLMSAASDSHMDRLYEASQASGVAWSLFSEDMERGYHAARISFLLRNLLISGNIPDIRDIFMEKPENTIDAETAEAVKLLRHQMHPPDISDRPKFRGARVEGIRASEFFDKHYGELKGDIDSSTIISHDKKLYDLLKAECHREGKPLTRFMRTHRDSLNQRRDAIAKVLGVPSHTDAAYEIYNFFSGIRER